MVATVAGAAGGVRLCAVACSIRKWWRRNALELSGNAVKAVNEREGKVL